MPTIKKINVGGVSYDIGGGLTEDVKQGLLNFAEKAAYSGPDYGQEVYDELYDAFYDNTWNVTNTLSNASTSNTATKTAKDGTYTAIISANTGYTLDGATVSVTMGGANVTSAVYSNGVVNIPAVTGDVVITVVAVALTVVSISAVYTQSGTVYDTDTLDSLKADLVVTATFNDSSTEVVPSADYTLSGTLTEGTSAVTVEYSGLTATFNVTVTERYAPIAIYNGVDANISAGTLTDSVGGAVATLNGFSSGAVTQEGLNFTGTSSSGQRIFVPYPFGSTGIGSQNWTVVAKLKLNDLTRTCLFASQDISAGGAFFFNIRPQQNILRMTVGSDVDATYIYDNNFHVFKASYNATSKVATLSVDGEELASGTITQLLTSTEKITFGGSGLWGAYFNGTLEYIKIYNEVIA